MVKRLSLFLAAFLFTAIGAMAQTQVSGTVVSQDDGEPVVGATVMVVGTNVGTATNMDGKFTLTCPKGHDLLRITYVGMEPIEVTARPNMRIVLTSDQSALDEVIVVAYGTSKKSSFTGSASTVNSQSIEKRPITNVTAALEGNATGIQVTSASGQPGESAAVRIRGFGSVNASNAPLYVVDGAIYNGSIGDINPSDIENITVLKDAASTSLYGSSAGNGVILITTKKGKTAGSSVSVDIKQGWSVRAYKDYAKVGVYDYYPLQWQMLKNSYVSTGKTDEEARTLATNALGTTLRGYNIFAGVANDAIVGTDGKLNPAANTLKWGDDLDWEDAAFKTGHRQEYNLSYNTKTDKSDTYASVGYLKDNGYVIKTDFERYSGRLNYNIYPVKWFKSGLNVSLNRSISNYSTADASNNSTYSNIVRFIRTMSPIYPIHKHDLNSGAYLDAEGNPTTNPANYVYDYDGDRLAAPGRDAIAETQFNSREFIRNGQNARTYVTISPIEGLDLTVNYSYGNSDYRRKVYENPYVGDGTAGPGRLNITSTRSTTQTLNQIINYNKYFGKHHGEIMLGHENYSYRYDYLYGMKTEETMEGLYEFGNFVNISSLSSYTDNYKKEGYFGRLNYDYDNKYYASVSYRRDGSSRFHKDNRWGNFWSFGASWRISEEPFMKNVTWVNNLKLRASYGETGNDGILDGDGYADYYPYQTLYYTGYKNFNEAGAYFTVVANPDLKWETQVSTDVAVEFTLFDRLTGTIEYFKKASKDLLFDVSQPLSTGVSSIIQNVGKVTNTGVEIDLDYKVLKMKDFGLSVGANATFLKNKITKLPDTMKDGYVGGSKKWVEGKSMYEFWLRQWYGVDPETGDGLWIADPEKYKEGEATFLSRDGKQLTNDYSNAMFDFSGASIPKVYGGFNVKANYKAFDFAAIFSYQLGGKLLDYGYQGLMATDSYGESMSPDLLNAWQKPGDITDVPRVDANGPHNTNISTSYSTRWLTKSDYLNLRSITIGYQLPKQVLNYAYLKSARLSFAAENLFMLKARQGLNPMAQFNGLVYNEYMPSRNFTFSLNVTF
ncbi:MAG: TonB-dependent receptor [Prevotella sp.]|nr:TonB-dependent receptor [Prevotella sp.]MBR6494340.1 TonB-dependent receptor [Prevotella sp.]